MIKLVILLFSIFPILASANLCPSAPSGTYGADDEDVANCKKFQKTWVAEYGIKREPMKLILDLEGLNERTSESIHNAKCIDDVTKRVNTLTENDLQELRALNSKNIANALRDGADRGRLKSEAEWVFRRLSKVVKSAQSRTRDEKQVMRRPILGSCSRLIYVRYTRLNELLKNLPSAAPAREPGKFITPGGGVTL